MAGKPNGRPTLYSPELAAKICRRISEGESVRKICRDPDMPNADSIYTWLPKYPEFSEQYARACEDRAHALAEEALEIADDGTNDTYVKDGAEAVNHDHIQRSRLRVDTRKWFASKLAPKKYGERVQQEVTGPGGAPLNIQVVRFSDTKD